MRKIFTLTLAVLWTLCIGAQMRVWVDGAVAFEKDLSLIDSITFVKAPAPVDPVFVAKPFSVNDDGGKVYFSPGNLQFQASTKTWQFAEHQYDMLGTANSAISENNNGWIDLFGWATSGYDNTANDPFAVAFHPWETTNGAWWDTTKKIRTGKILDINCEMEFITGKCDTTWEEIEYNSSVVNAYGYGPSTFMTDASLVATSANYDWGVFNAILNGGNEAGQWRTLTSEEWLYLLDYRPYAAYLRSQATVCGVHGYVLLPDDFKKPTEVSWMYQTKDWTTNTYDAETWEIMESVGAIFLPAGGYRYITDSNLNDEGYYWSIRNSNHDNAMILHFTSDKAEVSYNSRYYGHNVRLVQDVK